MRKAGGLRELGRTPLAPSLELIRDWARQGVVRQGGQQALWPTKDCTHNSSQAVKCFREDPPWKKCLSCFSWASKVELCAEHQFLLSWVFHNWANSSCWKGAQSPRRSLVVGCLAVLAWQILESCQIQYIKFLGILLPATTSYKMKHMFKP